MGLRKLRGDCMTDEELLAAMMLGWLGFSTLPLA